MSSDPKCIFCKIVDREIPSPRVYEDDTFICIRDIQPQAKIHFLLLPKAHVASLAAAFSNENQAKQSLNDALSVATKIASEQGLLPAGFRMVVNTGNNGGQTVHHLHFHLLGGEPLKGSFGA